MPSMETGINCVSSGIYRCRDCECDVVVLASNDLPTCPRCAGAVQWQLVAEFSSQVETARKRRRRA